MNFPSDPQFKLECSGETYINDQALNILVKRPENNISYLVVTVNDYQSSKFVDVFDTFDSIDLSLRYKADSWTKVFTGGIVTASPRLTSEGEILELGAWGLADALNKTHCDESYGVESIDNSSVNTPKEIIDDLITNHINKEFGGAASGYSIGNKVEDVHNGLSVTFLNSQYLNNFVNLNRVCDLANAYAQGLGSPEVSIHWFVDPSGNLYVKKIDADHTDGNWDHYYGGSQSAATIVVKQDMILYDFQKTVQEYANRIVLSSKLRKPSEDYWTEDNGGQALWGATDITKSDSATHIVGSHSLLLEPSSAVDGGVAYYPSSQDAAWDLTACGSQNTIPTLNMWVQRNEDLSAQGGRLRLYTDATNYYTLYEAINTFFSANDEWTALTFPVGPYFKLQTTELRKQWVATNNPDWADINYLEIGMAADVSNDLYIDDLHFSGVVVREASDAAEIAAHNAYQKVIRNDTAVNDTLKASDDSGTAAQLCYAELLRRSQNPTVALIQIPLLPDLLPGQTVHIHAMQKSDDTYRSPEGNADYRVKELRHVIMNTGFRTILNLTNDVTNSHALGVPTQYSMIKEYAGALAHSEARNLKGGALDNLIPRLSKSY